MIELVIIAALSENRTIGVDGRKPWHIPGDLKRFKDLTEGHPVIMERKTFQAIWRELNGRPLPNRHNIVLSRAREGFGSDVDLAKFFEEAVDMADKSSRDGLAYVIGGEMVFRVALAYPSTTRMELTYVEGTYAGDAHFPGFDESGWNITEKRSFEGIPRYTFVSYRRK